MIVSPYLPPQGPFVHICSIIADVMTRIGSRFFPIFNHVFVVSDDVQVTTNQISL